MGRQVYGRDVFDTNNMTRIWNAVPCHSYLKGHYNCWDFCKKFHVSFTKGHKVQGSLDYVEQLNRGTRSPIELPGKAKNHKFNPGKNGKARISSTKSGACLVASQRK